MSSANPRTADSRVPADAAWREPQQRSLAISRQLSRQVCRQYSRRSALALLAGAAAIGLCPGIAAAQSPSTTTLLGAPMSTRRIPVSGELLPMVGVGTWIGFDAPVGTEQYQRLPGVLAALHRQGGSVIDSSPMYGRAEAVVGELLKTLPSGRERSFLATKVWTQGREAGIAQMERSMALMNAEKIDLMQIHNLLDWRTHLSTLRQWKERGRIRYLGLTHYTSSAYPELEAAMRSAKPDFVQLNYSIDDRAAEARLLPLAQELGVAVLINMPFGGGGLLRSLADKPLPGWAGEIGCTSWAQILLKFVLSHPATTCAIPGTSRAEHMQQNALAGSGMLPDPAMRARMLRDWK